MRFLIFMIWMMASCGAEHRQKGTPAAAAQRAASYLRPQYPQLDDALVLLLSHSLRCQLQTTNQVDLSSFLNL